MKHIRVCGVAIMLIGFRGQAGQIDALAISANIQARHTPSILWCNHGASGVSLTRSNRVSTGV